MKNKDVLMSHDNFINDVHLVPSVVLRGNELLDKAPMDIKT